MLFLTISRYLSLCHVGVVQICTLPSVQSQDTTCRPVSNVEDGSISVFVLCCVVDGGAVITLYAQGSIGFFVGKGDVVLAWSVWVVPELFAIRGLSISYLVCM